MNIFVLDTDPRKCAIYHNNVHCIKMILETAQLLSGVHWVQGGTAPYKLSHKNHPCAIWARECIENYVWLCDLGIELSKEYSYRYGKRHKSQDIIEWCLLNIPSPTPLPKVDVFFFVVLLIFRSPLLIKMFFLLMIASFCLNFFG